MFESALEMDAAARDQFLRGACQGDDEILTEVRALLDQNERVGTFLTEPLFGGLAGQLFPAGREEILGGFRILKLLGSGGMGRVYEALELSTRRRVALKVLNANFSLHGDDVARFEREAWIGGKLSHPNIVKAYGQGAISGLHYISMELLEGPSLAADIAAARAEVSQKAGRIPTRTQAMVRLFAEVADALHHVHDSGIIHRDIKPQNLLFAAGASKLLLSDFGLARDEAASHLTRHAGFFGTIRYMPPERLLNRNAEATRTTDIWSLGLSLYEAVTLGLPNEPDNEAARVRHPLVSRDLETVLMKCLEREPDDRYQSAAALRDDLKRLAANEPVLARRPHAGVRLMRFAKKRWRPMVSAACAAALAMAAFILMPLQRRTPELLFRPFTTMPGGEYEPRFSPDEKQVAFIWGEENKRTFHVYIQNTDRSGLRRLTLPENANEGSPAWSPDGQAVAFIRTDMKSEDSAVLIKPLSGGQEKRVTTLVPVDHSFQRRLDWSPDGRYLALADAAEAGKPLAIFLVSPADGTRRQITWPISGTQGDTAPAFSPDGRTLSFLRFGASDIDEVYALPVAGGSPRPLTFDRSFISDYAWMPNGRELAVNSKRSGSIDLWVMPLDGGKPRPANGPAGGGYFVAVSGKRRLLALSMWAADTNIWRVDTVPGRPAAAKFTKIIDSTMDDRSGQYSPDGSRLAFRSNQSGTDEIWVADSLGKKASQLTFFDGPLTGTPRWSPRLPDGGLRLAFDSRPTGHGDIFSMPAGGGEPRRVTTGAGDNVVPSWSNDGKTIYFASNRLGDWQVYKVDAEGESPAHPAVPLTTGGGFSAFSSADGQWVYYAKGREIAGLWRVPVNGGREELVTADLQAGFWGYWAISESAVYFVSCDKLGHCSINSRSLTGGAASVVALLPKEPPFSDSGLGMTGNGGSFLIPQVDHAQSNILLGTGFR